MKKIVTAIVLIVAGLGLVGCNEEKPQAQSQEPEQKQQAKDINEAVGKSTAVPTLDLPEKGKYKY